MLSLGFLGEGLGCSQWVHTSLLATVSITVDIKNMFRSLIRMRFLIHRSPQSLARETQCSKIILKR